MCADHFELMGFNPGPVVRQLGCGACLLRSVLCAKNPDPKQGSHAAHIRVRGEPRHPSPATIPNPICLSDPGQQPPGS